MREAFKQRIAQALANPQLQAALDRNAQQRKATWEDALASLPNAADLRLRARGIRQRTLDQLDFHLRTFSRRLEEKNIQLHFAETAEQACRMVVELAQQRNAQLVVKSKSMLTEEIQLNQALEAAGIRVVETDLGEFIVQLRNEPPSHILAPALHLDRETIRSTFAAKLEQPASAEVSELARVARRALREPFLTAQVGISGINFGVAETGTLCLVTNEGNGRMVSCLPQVHIGVMGLERLIPTLEDLDVMLKLLPRSATGQKLTSYVSLMHNPRREGDPDGPEERHVILVDNQRRDLSESPLAESLLCIRCGACLNACPVFREIGGHAYASPYPGPIGSVISSGLFGVEEYGHLAEASTLCGACTESCPVGIDFPKLLLRVRSTYQEMARPSSRLRLLVRLYADLATKPNRFRHAQRLAAWLGRILPHQAGWLRSLPGPLSMWSDGRHFPAFASRPFRARFGKLPSRARPYQPERQPDIETFPFPEPLPEGDKLTRFGLELEALGGEFIRCSEAEAPDRVVGQLHLLGVSKIQSWGQVEPILFAILQRLEEDGFEVIQPLVPQESRARAQMLEQLDQVQVGLTGTQAGFSDTGTLALSTGRRRSLLPSLLPAVHLAVLRARDIYESMGDWLAAGGAQLIANTRNLTLISGPSRTADIEMTLSIGVHGPSQLVVFCIE